MGKIAVVGGGLTGLLVIRVLNRLGYCPTLIEPDFALGGLARGTVIGGNSVDAFPVFFSDNDFKRLQELGLELNVVEIELTPTLLKHGPLKAKMWGYRKGSNELVKDLEDPWPIKWKGRLLYPRGGWSKLIASWEKTLDFKWIHESLSRIDVGGKKVKTYHGRVIVYDKLFYTLPLPEIPRRIGVEFPFKPRTCHMVSISIFSKGKPGYDWITGFHGGTAILPHTIVYTTRIIDGVEGYHSVSALISYREEGLPAGFLEQTISRLRRMNIIGADVVAERVYNARYACINTSDIDEDVRRRLVEELGDNDIVLVGRRALWKEMSLGDLVENVLEQVTSNL